MPFGKNSAANFPALMISEKRIKILLKNTYQKNLAAYLKNFSFLVAFYWKLSTFASKKVKIWNVAHSNTFDWQGSVKKWNALKIEWKNLCPHLDMDGKKRWKNALVDYMTVLLYIFKHECKMKSQKIRSIKEDFSYQVFNFVDKNSVF